jgi:phage replication O-like protein O
MKENKPKNSYTTNIPNDMLEAIISMDLTSTEQKIVLLVIRKTYGFHKEKDWISYTQFMEHTRRSRFSVWSSIKKLVSKSILVRSTKLGKKTFYSINREKLVRSTIPVSKTKLVRSTQHTSKVSATQLVSKTKLVRFTILV